MTRPGLTIETSAQGVDRLVVHIDRADGAGGFELLQRVLPALLELDQLTRAPFGPQNEALNREA